MTHNKISQNISQRGMTCPMLQDKLPLNCLQRCADLTPKV